MAAASASNAAASAATVANAVISTGSNGAAIIPQGTTAQRPTPATGHFRFNSSLNSFEGYNGASWQEVAVLGTAQSFTTAHGFAVTTLTDGANIAWDLSANQVARVTLGGNRTLSNPTNKVEGNVYVLIVKQDGTGGRTLSFSSDYKFAGGTAPTITTTASKADVLTFVCEGTNLLGVASQSFL